ncbi:hypothetical protein LF1_36160 [Rubripirellula obstinata]|uniref:Cytochrome b561 domain-containing protein n=1 Tax=Rubripirellula obstinata TaxID=406547 RepID=A0A5B1CL60_9BACT|nr:hypothetical protein [Rubripirellula obstinata]KAA1261072.1 hypothetical protein LF1_36160 [Rubripirellula obstinata]
MMLWIERALAMLLVGLVVVLTATTAVSWGGHGMSGLPLLIHMGASGALVFTLPVYAIIGLIGFSRRHLRASMYNIGFWGSVAFGLPTIATVFLCMLPIASTDTMHQLVSWHAWAGYALTIAAVVLVIGLLRRKVA